jgi:hypothetical protein
VGKTASGLANAGIEATASNILRTTKASSASAEFNRTGTDGDIAIFWKDTSPVGSIGTDATDIYIGTTDTGIRFNDAVNGVLPYNTSTGQTDATLDLGFSSVRWKDLYLSGGALTTTVKFLANSSVSGSDATIFRPADNNMAFSTNGVEQMRINPDGIILVGTTSPSAGFITCMELKGTEAPLSIINETATDAGDRTSIGFRNAAGTMVGNVGVNNSATVFNTTSDYRLKENVDYTFDATTRLKKLKPARFNFIAQPDNTIDGFMAHEVQDIVPEAITGVKDATETKTNAVVNSYGNYIAENITEEEWLAGKENGTYDADTTWAASHTQNIYQGIDQSKLVPLLTKALQEQQTIIESLEARITALES